MTSDARDRIHIAIMHDRRRAERLGPLVALLGSRLEDVRSGRDSSITIGDGTRRGPWTAMKWCLLDFLASGRPWLLLLEDDAMPTAGAVGSDQWPVSSDQCGKWKIREACAEIAARWERAKYSDAVAIHLCCGGGDAADRMDNPPASVTSDETGIPVARLDGAAVGTVAVLIGRTGAHHIRRAWECWDTERAFEKQYAFSLDAGDARLWEMERGVLIRNQTIVRFITTRSLVEHGCAGEGESLVREGWDHGLKARATEENATRERPARRMHNPIEGCPVEWVKAMSDGGCRMADVPD